MNDPMKLMMAAVDQQIDQMCKQALTLSGLVHLLSTPSIKDDASIRFDFPTSYRPSTYDSYRGYYRYIALGHGSSEQMTVSQLLEMTQEAIDKTYEGYKGGDFTMDGDTPIWVANYGDASGIAVVGVKITDYEIVLQTAYIED